MKIILVCNAGMSTGIMQLKLEEEAKLHGVDAVIEAIPISEIEQNIADADAILLGPQIRFASEDIKQMVEHKIPVLTIELQDFGLMRADHVFAQTMKAIEEGYA